MFGFFKKKEDRQGEVYNKLAGIVDYPNYRIEIRTLDGEDHYFIQSLTTHGWNEGWECIGDLKKAKETVKYLGDKDKKEKALKETKQVKHIQI